MANQRSTFAKRQREQKLLDKANAKKERRAAKRAGTYIMPDASNGSPAGDESPPPVPPASPASPAPAAPAAPGDGEPPREE